MSIASNKCLLGVIASTGEVNTVAALDRDNVMECLQAGEIVIPCTTEQARAAWGRRVMPPLDLASAIVEAA